MTNDTMSRLQNAGNSPRPIAKALAVVAVALSVGLPSSVMAADYYWTGAVDTLLATPGNWNDVDGQAMTVAPGTSDTLIFDGLTEDVSLTFPKMSGKSEAQQYARCVVTNAAATVKLVPDTNAGTFKACPGGFSIHGTSGGLTLYKGFSVGVTADVDVGAGMLFYVDGGHVQSVKPGVNLVKRGAGMWKLSTSSGHRIYCSGGDMEIWEGTFDFQSGAADKGLTNINIKASGPAPKTIVFPVNPMLTYRVVNGNVLGSYSESAEAEGTVSIVSPYNGSVTLQGLPDSPRASERMTAEFRSSSDYPTGMLVWDPKSAASTLTYAKARLTDPKVTLKAASGKIRFTEGFTLTTSTTLAAEAGAALAVAADCGTLQTAKVTLSGAASRLEVEEGARNTVGDMTLASGATVDVANDACLVVKSLTVGGAAAVGGLYRAADVPWVTGAGFVLVAGDEPETTEATWVGGADGNSVLAAANWGGTLPDLASGSLVATFPADAQVVVPSGTEARLKGIVVQDGVAGQTFSATGPGALWLGSEGVKTQTTSGQGKLSFAGEILFLYDQTWQVGVTNAISFETTARLRSVPGVVWTSRGAESGTRANAGAMRISCSNPDLGDCVLYHVVTVEADSALGGASATAVIDAGHNQVFALTANGCTLENAIVRVANANNSTGNRGLCVQSGTTVVRGLFESHGGNINSWEIAADAVIRFEGGVREMRNLNPDQRFVMRGKGKAYVTGVPATLRKMHAYEGGEIFFGVAGNVVERGIHMVNGSTLHTTEANALVCGSAGEDQGNVMAVRLLSNSVWNLHGKDQTVQALLGESGGTVTSDTDATVRILANATYKTSAQKDEPEPTLEGKDLTADACVFAGGAGLVKDGPYDHTCHGVSTSTGRIEVVQGALVFAPGASWKNASAVRVSGTGTLSIPGGRVFGTNAAMTIDTAKGAEVDIPAGQVLRVASLTVDGVSVSGTYEGAGVTGGGKIFAGKSGLFVIVR